MHYYLRRSFDPERADDIIGPLSLDEARTLIRQGQVVRSDEWLFLCHASESAFNAMFAPEHEWHPVRELETSKAAQTPSDKPTRSAAGMVLHVLMWIVIWLVILFVIFLAIVYAACHNMRLN